MTRSHNRRKQPRVDRDRLSGAGSRLSRRTHVQEDLPHFARDENGGPVRKKLIMAIDEYTRQVVAWSIE